MKAIFVPQDKPFTIDVLSIGESEKESMMDAVQQLKELKAGINTNTGRNRRDYMKLKLKQKYLQKKINEYKKLHPGFDLKL